MARSRTTHLIDTNDMAKSPLVRKHLTRQDFGKRLYSMMLEKGWTQSEFARQADIPRDRISNFVRGNNMPEPHNLKKIAKALGVEPDDLLPNYTEEAIQMELNPALEVRASSSDPTRSWVRLNREVSTATVIKLMQALEEDPAPPAAKRK